MSNAGDIRIGEESHSNQQTENGSHLKTYEWQSVQKSRQKGIKQRNKMKPFIIGNGQNIENLKINIAPKKSTLFILRSLLIFKKGNS